MQHTLEEPRADVRARMAEVGRGWPRPLAAAAQSYLSWLSGKPLAGRRRLLRVGPAGDALLTLACLAGGVALSLAALRAGPRGWILLAPGWIATTGALRKLFIVVQHGLVHGALPGGRRANALATDALALLAFLPSYARFRDEHVVRHHGASFGGPDDPDAALLLALGLAPGVSRRRLWLRFAAALVSPRYHWLYARSRLADAFLAGPSWRRAAAAAGCLAVLAATHAAGAWRELALAWLVPAFPLFHAAALAAIVGEHLWFAPREEGETMARYQRRLTSARFLGSAPPPPGAGTLRGLPRRLAWGLAHVTYWPAVRLAIVPGDLPAHDFHHSHPNVPWTETLHARAEALARGDELSETWGAFAAIDRTFASLARLPASIPERDPR